MIQKYLAFISTLQGSCAQGGVYHHNRCQPASLSVPGQVDLIPTSTAVPRFGKDGIDYDDIPPS